MKTTIKAFVFMEEDYRGAWAAHVYPFKMDEQANRVFIGEQLVEVEVPDKFNPVPAQVRALEAQKSEALKKYQASVAQINDRLSKLLAIGNEVSA